MPFLSRSALSSADPSREIDEHSTTIFGFAFPASSRVTTSFTSFQVDTMTNTISREASSGSLSATSAPYFFSGSAFSFVRFQARTSAPPLARSAAISKPMRPAPIQPTVGNFLVGIGDRKLLRWIERDDPGALGREHDLFLDTRGRDAVFRRAEGLDREHHAGLQLVRLDE